MEAVFGDGANWMRWVLNVLLMRLGMDGAFLDISLTYNKSLKKVMCFFCVCVYCIFQGEKKANYKNIFK